MNSNCALDCMNVATSVRMAGVMGQLVQHESNDDIHVTKEEKEKLESIINNPEDNSDITEIKLTLGNKADKEEIPTKLSQLENDVDFISSIPDFYTTEEEVKLLIQGYLEEHKNPIEYKNISEEDAKRLEQLINQLMVLVNDNSSEIANIKSILKNEQQ